MLKKFKEFSFPILIGFSFILFPLLFSFDGDLEKLPNSKNVTQLHQNDYKKPELTEQFFLQSSNLTFKSEGQNLEIVPYNQSQISIFSQAISSLMNYYLLPFDQLQLSSSATSQISKSEAYNAGRFGPAFSTQKLPEDFEKTYTKKFFFDSYDRYKKVAVPQRLVTNGHLAVQKQSALLPKIISKEDFKIQFSPENMKPMFLEQFSSYFGNDFKKQFGKDPEKLAPKMIRRTLIRFWDGEERVRNKTYAKIKKDLFENSSVVKLTGCKYGYQANAVTIYYDLNTDLFGIIDEKTNSFLTGGIASLCDYIDIYYFKCLNQEKTFNQSIKLNVPPETLEQKFEFPSISLGQEFELFDKWRDFGLAENYDPVNWWKDTQDQLVKFFLESMNQNSVWYNNLKIGDSQEVNDTSEFEAFTMLQLEAEGFFTGIFRPDKINNQREKDLNTDARFLSFNPDLIKFCRPTIIDVKVPIDPAALAAFQFQSQKPVRTLEEQVTDLVNAVEFQQKRSKTDFNETVLHVINLLRIRPVDRSLVISMFKAKSSQRQIDLNCILFLNTRDDSIY